MTKKNFNWHTGQSTLLDPLWLVYYLWVLLGSMSEAWMKENTACVKEPNMVGYLIGSLTSPFTGYTIR